MAKKEKTKVMTVQERNEWFASLTKEQKRVEIAKDVISQLDLKKMKTAYKTYTNFVKAGVDRYSGSALESVTDLQEFITQDDVQCSVCGIGGLFVSKVTLGDNCPIKVPKGRTLNIDAVSDFFSDQEVIHKELKGIFRPLQLFMIEACYEQTTYHASNVDGNWDMKPGVVAAADYGRELHKHDEELRLRAIMQNIIDNNGTFVVPRIHYNN